MAALVAFRAAAWDTPLYIGPSRRSYRFNDDQSDATQYWALHPLGPLAEMLRWRHIRTAAFAAELRVRLWAARFDDDRILRIGFDDAHHHGIDGAELVSDDYNRCQQWASSLRATAPGIIVPSAALPGTENLVLFGPRVRGPYGAGPIDVQLEVPTDPTPEAGQPPEDLLRLVRWRGTSHAGLDASKSGATMEPPRVRLTRA